MDKTISSTNGVEAPCSKRDINSNQFFMCEEAQLFVSQVCFSLLLMTFY